jgi:voltage-gated potassium channel
MSEHKPLSPWRAKIHEIIFEADTPMGKLFDVLLLILILASVLVVSLDSVADIHAKYETQLLRAEWTFTIIFTVEYFLRLISTGKPLKYVFSFFGIVDLLSVLPTYLAYFFGGGSALLVIRVLRLLRVFRVLKLMQFVAEAQVLKSALKSSLRKITIFIGGVLSLCVLIGTLMFFIEGDNPESNFTSIPQGIYWAIVTLTTVGYGDIAPVTVLGKFMASLVMIMGYGVIAVPTGIVTVELAKQGPVSTQACPDCSLEGHDSDAKFCKFCGSHL